MEGIAETTGKNREKTNTDQARMDYGELAFSQESLNFSLKPGERTEGSFTIFAPEGVIAEGWMVSSKLQMECLTEEFVGAEAEVSYRFSSMEMAAGETLDGYFYIISNCGEYELPYRIEIEDDRVESSLGTIKNMFHFANLAKASWEEAVKAFYSPQFKKIFSAGADRQYYNAYKGLSAVPGNEQNMEEFLLETNKKQRVEFVPEKMEVLIDDPVGVSEHSISIGRSGWGYTFLGLEAEGDFLRLDKEKVMEYDFLGNQFRLVFYVDGSRLHGGRNYGSIHLTNSYLDITIPVTVVCSVHRQRLHAARKEKKKLLTELMECYCSFRGKKISSRVWMGETEKLVERLAALDTKDIQTGLFRAQLLITQGRFNEVKWQMERLKTAIDEGEYKPEVWCYYLYLTTLYNEDEDYVEGVSERIGQIYNANRDNWRIAWLMLYLREEYVNSPARRWELLEEQFMKGCSSPILYMEAWHLLEINPTLLMGIGRFETQVLNFAARRKLISQDLFAQVRYHAQKMKGYSERIFFILKDYYEEFPDDETLQAICALLIKGNKTDSVYFPWYSLGVEQELRITKLYEYYMMALPEGYMGEIPKAVLMYFAYQSGMDYRKTAFLYAYIYRKRTEAPEYYIKFCSQMEEFVVRQLSKGRINKDLAYLYRHIITPELLNEERAGILVTLLFTHMVYTDNKKMRHVVVEYAFGGQEYKYPMSDGQGAVPLYGDEYKMFLEDGEGNRYSASIVYRLERMMRPEKLLQMAMPYVTEHAGLDIYLCESNKSFLEITYANVDKFRRIAFSPSMDRRRRNEVILKLIHYYYEQDDLAELEDYLKRLEPEGMTYRERGEAIRFMVIRGMHDKAFQWVKRFGVSGVDVKTVMRMCSRLLSRDGFMENKYMTHMVYYAFHKGKYDSNLIIYLVHFYRGMLWQLEEIWKAAVSFEVETYEICERILVQTMFSGAYIGERTEIFKTYVSGGAKPEVETAFLTQCAYDYFIKEKPMDVFLFMDAARVYERGERLHRVCKLAFLKYFSEHKEEMTPKAERAAGLFLTDLLEDGIYFAFFKEYGGKIPAVETLADKTIIEYRTKPGSRVVIHYMIERGKYTEDDYRQEEMRDMYGGIYVKAFILFFGEKLQYYITEELDEEKQFTQSASVSRGEVLYGREENRFELINDIAAAGALHDYDTLDWLLESYYKKEYMVSKVFRLLKD